MFLYGNKHLNIANTEDVASFRQTVQRASRNKQEQFTFQGNTLETDFGLYLLTFLRHR